MTEFLSRTHAPGADGQTFGVAPDQSVLYEWMRVLAGGGTSEFSAIRMRGPLTLSDGSLVNTAKYVEVYSGGTTVFTFPPGPAEFIIDQTTGIKNSVQKGGLVAAAGNTCVVSNAGTETLDVVITFSVTMAVTAGGPAELFLLVTLGGATVNPPATGLTVSAAVGEHFTLTGTYLIEGWNPGVDLAFGLEQKAGGGVSVEVQSSSISILPL